MTTPIGLFSPFAKLDSLEGKNVGTGELLPFSVVEVVDAERPEEDHPLTIGGGRTVLHIKAATINSPGMVVVVGPQRIPAGEHGPVTAANICYAKYTGTIAIGNSVGVAVGTTALATGYSGFWVLGDINAGESICRVMRQGGGGGGGEQIGILTADVNHMQVRTVELLQQIGTYSDGETAAALVEYSPPQYIDCLNITSLTLRGGTPQAGPYMDVLSKVGFDMPLVFPAQIEACLQPSQQLNTGAQ